MKTMTFFPFFESGRTGSASVARIAFFCSDRVLPSILCPWTTVITPRAMTPVRMPMEKCFSVFRK